MKATIKLQNHGFTLIELILALVVSSILGVMLMSYLVASINEDPPMENLKATLELAGVMENIRTTYQYSNTGTNGFSLEALKDKIGQPANNPHSNSYGEYNVIHNDFVECDPATASTFSSSTAKDFLMVTISSTSTQGIRATALFSAYK